MKVLPTIVALMFLSLASASPFTMAETTSPAETGIPLAEVRDRLNLSDEQVAQMAPVMEESLAARRSILARYGIDPDVPGGPAEGLGFRKARAMRSELQTVRADTLAKLEGILNEEQLEEFKRMQEDQRAEMRERIQGRASSDRALRSQL